MTEQQFIDAIDAHPEITASGFGVTQWGDVTEARVALYNFYEAFSRSYEFLKATDRKDLEKMFKADSYALKHVVERGVGTYIPEGAFDLAAVVFGCTVDKAIENSPSVYFALPEVPSLEVDGQPNIQI